MTGVKICGIRSLEEAMMVSSLGAWAIGEVFASSPRQIEVEKAAAINHQLDAGVLRIGVFVNEKIDSVKHVAQTCSLDIIQLHGDESPEYVAELNIPVIKSFSVTGPVDPDYVKQWRPWAYLFDTFSPGVRGGSGISFNWQWLEEIKDCERVILAGGLNYENVAAAIRNVRPMAVDVSSGVEFPQRGKDPLKVKMFIQAVQEADTDVSQL